MNINQCLAAGTKGVFNLDIAEYHALEGISGSKVKYLEISNRHYDKSHLFFQMTAALKFGNLFHTLTLEETDFDARYVVCPEFKGAGKTDAINEFYEHNKDKIIVTEADFKRAKRMARNVHALYADVLCQGVIERSLFVEADGLILKSRIDCDIEEIGDDIDLKSITLGTKPYSNDTLEAHIRKFGYDLSAAFRNVVRRSLGKPVNRSFLLFCDTGQGNVPRLIQIHPEWIRAAEKRVEDMLESRRIYLTLDIDVREFEIIDDRTRKIE